MCAFWRRDGYRVTEWVPNSLLFKNPSTCPHLEVRKKNPLPKRDHFMPIAVVKIGGHGIICQKYVYFGYTFFNSMGYQLKISTNNLIQLWLYSILLKCKTPRSSLHRPKCNFTWRGVSNFMRPRPKGPGRI